ncbi:hypothetical protein CEXT_357271 [Caerostris extrusa]|uniref:Uncharacterized protein n=1 Tax=Caerostris extrusa TaxID=172846 RepID=A0AAV4SS60_CAEEX|nr:hypothetical protein CEXT_357271 [Caerostris extrusa]
MIQGKHNVNMFCTISARFETPRKQDICLSKNSDIAIHTPAATALTTSLQTPAFGIESIVLVKKAEILRAIYVVSQNSCRS